MGNIASSAAYLISNLPSNVWIVLEKAMAEDLESGYLNLSDQSINDNMMPELCEWIIKLGDKVKELNLSKNRITSQGASELFESLKMSNSSITFISLSYNSHVGDRCMKSLGEYIKSNKSITTLFLDRTAVSDKGIEILTPYLDGNTTFRHLCFFYNTYITPTSLDCLRKMVLSSQIDGIDLYQSGIYFIWDLNYELACNSIKNGRDGLSLHRVCVDDKNSIIMCNIMKEYGIDYVKKINLTKATFSAKGMSMFFETLNECNSIVSTLDMQQCTIQVESINSLGKFIQNNEYLEELNVSDSNLTDKAIEILSEYLIGNVKLMKLDLSENKEISDASSPFLLEAIKSSALKSLVTLKTSISEESWKEIHEALEIPVDKREVPIKSNTKSAAKISVKNE